MSDRRDPPIFDDEFWRTVHERADRVRAMVHEQIEEAEQTALSTSPAAQPSAVPSGKVVAVFTDSFWEEVSERARRVREIAVEDLVAAEARLLEEPELVATVAPERRRGVGAGLSGLTRTFNLQRSDAFGLVAAVLVAVLLIPQLIVPVWSNAGMEPPKILRMVLIGDKDRTEATGATPNDEPEAGASESTDAADGSSGSGSSTGSEPGGSSPSGTTQGGEGATGAEGGTGSDAEQGAQGAAATGADGTSAQPSPSPSPSPSPDLVAKPPAAPLDVHAVAVDPTSIRISWTDASADESAFQVERQVAEGAARSVARAPQNSSSYFWANLTPDTRVCFRARAMSDAGPSEWSPAAAPGYACATTPAAPAQGPPPPGGPPPQPEASPTAPPAA